ncbi:MAG: hypothetical protein LBM65_01720 [Oscillospiraceae bacterium]|jgi:hypothetical protein|nr:hypothetical protein [Oscillospiraceae bacterium]
MTLNIICACFNIIIGLGLAVLGVFIVRNARGRIVFSAAGGVQLLAAAAALFAGVADLFFVQGGGIMFKPWFASDFLAVAAVYSIVMYLVWGEYYRARRSPARLLVAVVAAVLGIALGLIREVGVLPFSAEIISIAAAGLVAVAGFVAGAVWLKTARRGRQLKFVGLCLCLLAAAIVASTVFSTYSIGGQEIVATVSFASALCIAKMLHSASKIMTMPTKYTNIIKD